MRNGKDNNCATRTATITKTEIRLSFKQPGSRHVVGRYDMRRMIDQYTPTYEPFDPTPEELVTPLSVPTDFPWTIDHFGFRLWYGKEDRSKLVRMADDAERRLAVLRDMERETFQDLVSEMRQNGSTNDIQSRQFELGADLKQIRGRKQRIENKLHHVQTILHDNWRCR